MARPALALSLLLVLAAPAHAGPLGFGDPERVDGAALRQVAAAAGTDGTIALAGTGDRVTLARRRPGQGWERFDLGAGRDPQAAVAPSGTVAAAWRDQRAGTVNLALARASGRPAVRRFAGTTPRLAVLGDGSTLLVFRRGRELWHARGSGAPRRLARGAAGFAVAAAGDGAVVAWTTPLRRTGAPRAAYALRLDRRGRPSGRPFLVSHDAGAALRLAGAAGGRAVAAWVRPRRGERPAGAFTRSLPPVARPARPVFTMGDAVTTVPGVALRGEGGLLAVRTLSGPAGGFRTVLLRSRFGGVWTGARLAGGASPMTSTPRAVLAEGDEGFAVWSSAPPAATGVPRYDVLVARRGEAPQRLASGLATTDGRGVGVGVAGDGRRVVVGWPHPDGGFGLATRR